MTIDDIYDNDDESIKQWKDYFQNISHFTLISNNKLMAGFMTSDHLLSDICNSTDAIASKKYLTYKLCRAI